MMTQPARTNCVSRPALHWLFGLLTCGSLAFPPMIARGAAPDASDVLERIARPAPATTRFVEIRFSSLLTTPLVVSGELDYQSATSFAKRIERPYHEQMNVSGDEVSVVREGEPLQHFSLKRAPELRSMLTAFGSLLAGDSAAVAQQFQIAVAEDGDSWQLVLTPRDPAVARRLQKVIVAGRAHTPRCLIVTEAGDNASIMLLGDASLDPLPEPLELAALNRRCGNPER
jgi:hypothetical protein